MTMTQTTTERPKRSPNPCLGQCGRRTERQCGYCQKCAPPTPAAALTGGRWVQAGAIRRWIEG